MLKSTYHGELQLNMSALVVDEITIVGSRCGPFGPALRLRERAGRPPGPLISDPCRVSRRGGRLCACRRNPEC